MSEMASGSGTAVRTQSQQKSKTGSGGVRPPASAGMRTRQQANLDTLRSTLKRIRSGSVAKNAKPATKKRRTSVLEIGLRPELVEISASEKESLQPIVSEIEIDPSEDEEKQPTLQKALVVARKGQYEIRHDFPIPVLGDNEVMIRSHYVGLNPIDWKSVDYNFCLPDFPWVRAPSLTPPTPSPPLPPKPGPTDPSRVTAVSLTLQAGYRPRDVRCSGKGRKACPWDPTWRQGLD